MNREQQKCSCSPPREKDGVRVRDPHCDIHGEFYPVEAGDATPLGAPPATPQTETPDVTCEHGTAMDVHCCHCHSGFIFDRNHECPPRQRGWREALEDALGLAPDAENHTPEWAFKTVRVIREIGNAALSPPPDVERLTRIAEVSMESASDPNRTAEAYRRALLDVCNIALSSTPGEPT